MASARAYLDWNASTPLLPEARAAMLAAMDQAGNPSSVHAEGRAARAVVETARGHVAALAGGEAENVVFTSGATEAISAVLASRILGCCGSDLAAGARTVLGATEHAAAFASAGKNAEITGVDAEGRIDVDFLRAMLATGEPALVMIQLANNETGVVQDIPALADIVHEARGALVVDAVQGPGKLDDLAGRLGAADATIFSAHKFGGPKGVGALVFRDARTRLAKAFIAGGGQERGSRGGTENIPGIAGMGAAAKVVALAHDIETMTRLRDDFEVQLNRLADDVRIVGRGVERLANTSLFAIPGIPADRALIALDLDDVAVSSGSACSSGKVKASHVLKAMGERDWVMSGALRLSMGPATTRGDLARCLASLEKLITQAGKKASAA